MTSRTPISKLRIGGLLGQGTFSTVHALGDRFAIKMPRRTDELFLSEMDYFTALATRSLGPKIYSIDDVEHIVVVERMLPLLEAIRIRGVEVVAIEVLHLMAALANCGVVCCDMKIENVAVAEGGPEVYLIDPGLELTGFQLRTQGDYYHKDRNVRYAFVTAMLTIFIAVSFNSAAARCNVEPRNPNCTCASCSDFAALRYPLMRMLARSDVQPWMLASDTHIWEYNDGIVKSVKLSDKINFVYDHYLNAYKGKMKIGYPRILFSATYDKWNDALLHALRIAGPQHPIYADLGRECITSDDLTTTMTMDENDVTIRGREMRFSSDQRIIGPAIVGYTSPSRMRAPSK